MLGQRWPAWRAPVISPPVCIPEDADETIRDPTRPLEDAFHDLNAARYRLKALLLLETELFQQAKPWRLCPVVEALQTLRGVLFTVAITTMAELGDLIRFDHPRQLMSYLGFMPSENSSGGAAWAAS